MPIIIRYLLTAFHTMMQGSKGVLTLADTTNCFIAYAIPTILKHSQSANFLRKLLLVRVLGGHKAKNFLSKLKSFYAFDLGIIQYIMYYFIEINIIIKCSTIFAHFVIIIVNVL